MVSSFCLAITDFDPEYINEIYIYLDLLSHHINLTRRPYPNADLKNTRAEACFSFLVLEFVRLVLSYC